MKMHWSVNGEPCLSPHTSWPPQTRYSVHITDPPVHLLLHSSLETQKHLNSSTWGSTSPPNPGGAWFQIWRGSFLLHSQQQTRQTRQTWNPEATDRRPILPPGSSKTFINVVKRLWRANSLLLYRDWVAPSNRPKTSYSWNTVHRIPSRRQSNTFSKSRKHT